MRSTIRVFIKTELRKRETSRAKQSKDTPPATASPVEAKENTQSSGTGGAAAILAGASQEVEASSNIVDNAGQAENSQVQEVVGAEPTEDAPNNHDNTSSSGAADKIVRNPHSLCDVLAPAAYPSKPKGGSLRYLLTCRNRHAIKATETSEGIADAESAVSQTDIVVGNDTNTDVAPATGSQEATDPTELSVSQNEKGPIAGNSMNGNGGFDGNTATEGFAGMNANFTGDYSQMQMMMAMQGGMMPNGFGFPMMGKFAREGLSTRSRQVLENQESDAWRWFRHAWHEYGPRNAGHVHEWRIRGARHGHERHERHEQHEHDGWRVWRLRVQ